MRTCILATAGTGGCALAVRSSFRGAIAVCGPVRGPCTIYLRSVETKLLRGALAPACGSFPDRQESAVERRDDWVSARSVALQVPDAVRGQPEHTGGTFDTQPQRLASMAPALGRPLIARFRDFVHQQAHHARHVSRRWLWYVRYFVVADMAAHLEHLAEMPLRVLQPAEKDAVLSARESAAQLLGLLPALNVSHCDGPTAGKREHGR